MEDKRIHYCWFGNTPFPEKEKKCIESWKKFLPDYELILWNEETFDMNVSMYVKEAYEQKAYAFVSDYVRVYALYNFGGLYLDTDFEILDSRFRKLIENDSPLLGFETRSHLGTAIMSFPKGHRLMSEFLQYYNTHNFIDKNGRIDNTANVTILSDLLKNRGLRLDGTRQYCDNITIFNREYFFPKRIGDNEFRIVSETCGVHRCSNSWMTETQKKRGKNKFWVNVCRPILSSIRKNLIRMFGKECARNIEIIFRNQLK